jgi:hypothetical protein
MAFEALSFSQVQGSTTEAFARPITSSRVYTQAGSACGEKKETYAFAHTTAKDISWLD